MNWVIIPYRGNIEQTEVAVGDVLAQTVPDVRLLLINQGDGDTIDIKDARVFHWKHQPPLPSLSATWNHALRMVWGSGGLHALVVNNDVRLHPQLYETLTAVQRATQAWFVSACNVGETAWTYVAVSRLPDDVQDLLLARGGPDFSCFLITQDCHVQYPFDEGFQPAYCEDLDYHRRLMLDGKSDKIFSVAVPYLHYASGTLKAMTPRQRQRLEDQISAGSRTYYRRKWGGDVNQERYRYPFDPTSDQDGVTTPNLQFQKE